MGARRITLSAKHRRRENIEIVDAVPAIIYIYDLETHTTIFFNRGIEQILGYSNQEIQAMGGKLFQNLVHPDDLEFIPEHDKLFSSVSEKDIIEIEYRMKDRQGNWHHFLSYERPFRRKTYGAVQQKLGIAIDFSEKQQAKETLTQLANKLDRSNQILRLMIEFTPAPIAIFDREMHYLAVSRRYLEDYHLPKKNIIGKSHYDIFPEIPEHWKEIYQRCLSGETKLMDEEAFTRKDGSLDWIRWEIHPWYEDPQQIGGVILFSEVITKQKRAQQALAESEERYRNILETAPVGIAVYSDGKIVFINPVCAQMLAAESVEQIRGKPISEIIHPDGLDTAKTRIQRMLAGEKGLYPVEEMYLRLDGIPFQVEVFATPLHDDEKAAAQVILTDITERKKKEKELLQQRNRLEVLSKSLINAHESEQRALGRELHDQIGQMLTALKLTLEIIPSLPPERANTKLAQAQDLVIDLQKQISNLSIGLRPPILDDFGIIPALLWHFNRYEDQTSIKVAFKHFGLEGKRFAPETETATYRIVQEALTNIARHARCKQANIQLCLAKHNLHISIEDDGQGFDPQDAIGSLESSGLSGIRERAGLLNGNFSFKSTTRKRNPALDHITRRGVVI